MSKVVQLNTNDTKVFVEGHTKKIKDVISQIKNDFIYIGYLLWEIREYKYYEYYGYKNVTEYGEKELLLEQSYVSRLIKLCENYSSRSVSDFPSMKLSDTYKSYSEWQLVAMLSVPKENREEVSPDMSVKEIRKFSKQLKEKNVTSHNLEDVSQVECKTLICSNCGEHYPVDVDNKKQWIVINNKPVFQCCFQIKWDIDLLKKD